MVANETNVNHTNKTTSPHAHLKGDGLSTHVAPRQAADWGIVGWNTTTDAIARSPAGVPPLPSFVQSKMRAAARRHMAKDMDEVVKQHNVPRVGR